MNTSARRPSPPPDSTPRTNGARRPAVKGGPAGRDEHRTPAGSSGVGECPMERPTTQIEAVHEPVPARHFQAPPPRPPEANTATTQANRKLAWLLAGVVAVAGGLLIGFLRADTPASAPVPLVTPQPAAEQDASSAQPPSDALSHPLTATPEPTSSPSAPSSPPAKKAAPKPTARAARPRVPLKVTTTKPTTTPTAAISPNTGSTLKNSKKGNFNTNSPIAE